MNARSRSRRLSFAWVCALPVLGMACALRMFHGAIGLRPLGVVCFAATVLAVWRLSIRSGGMHWDDVASLRVAGVCLVAPFTAIALLWGGLGTPWEASVAENEARYLVLLAAALCVAVGGVVLAALLHVRGARVLAPIALTLVLIAGAAYVMWTSVQVGLCAGLLRDGNEAPLLRLLGNAFEALLSVAALLTYLSTSTFARALWQVGWMSRRAAFVYMLIPALAALCLILQAASVTALQGGTMPWYLQPGFVVGIPAIPWLLPHFLGALLLRRAGDVVTTRNAA